MSNPEVLVTVDENNVDVTINPHNPVITVTDNTTGNVTAIQSGGNAVVTTPSKPEVTIYLGGLVQYNRDAILSLLEGSISSLHFTLDTNNDLDAIDSALTVLTQADIDQQVELDTNTAAIGVIDGQIISIASDVSVIDGELTAAQSSIQQNATDILTTVSDLTTAQGDILANTAQIAINSDQISLHASKFTTNDADIVRLDGLISVSASDIVLAVNRISTVEGLTTSQGTAITANADAITAQAIIVNAQGVTIAQTTVDVTAHGILINTIDGNVTATTEMLANKWSVQMTEDPSGNPYSTGFALSLHENWADATAYVIDDMIWWQATSTAYKCILGHTSSSANEPPNATYWTAVTTEDKSNFTIQVDKFQIQTTDGTSIVTPFQVTASAVTIDGSLIADTIESSNFVTGTSGFQIDIDTGAIEFNDMVATFANPGDVQEALSIDVFEGNWAVGHGSYVVGDTVINDGIMFRCKLAHSSAADKEPPNATYWDNIGSYDRHASDVTKIDGGKIYTGSIIASAITVSNIAEINSDLGIVVSGSLESSNDQIMVDLDATGSERVFEVLDGSLADLFYVTADGTVFSKRPFAHNLGSTSYTTGSGNFTVPSGVYKLIIDAGAGGAGGGHCYGISNIYCGCGGNGGAGVRRYHMDVTPAQVIAYSVGAGGVGGVSNGSGGTTSVATVGGDTTFGTLTLRGGLLGNFDRRGPGNGVSGKGGGGRGSASNFSAYAGDDCEGKQGGQVTSASLNCGGGGGASMYGDGGDGGDTSSANGQAGSAYGGGGGGGGYSGSYGNGGAGASGFITIYY